MSSTLLELMRVNHELAEKNDLAIGDELDSKPNGQKAKIMQQHRLKQLIDTVVELNRWLDTAYDDCDGALRDDLASMKDQSLDSFYGRLRATREFHQNYPAIGIEDGSHIKFNDDVQFSGEEVYGKYLDLNNLYLQFSDLCRKFSLELDYAQYLERFDSFFYLPKKLRLSKSYNDYLEDLWQYLRGFFSRVFPLLNLDELVTTFMKDFHEKRRNNSLPGLDLLVDEASQEPHPLRLGMFGDVSELEALGLNRLKEALEALGLKCGGTLQDRAARLWSVRGKNPADFPSHLLAKSKKRSMDKNDDTLKESKAQKSRIDTVEKEFLVSSLCGSMAEVIAATRRHAEKQQTRTLEEKEAELLEEERGLLPDVIDGAVEDEDEEPVYNPLNLPIGWDGKPIPFWLYKLHGLGVEYKCEICGNQSYWGRRAFDRHFQEWRHAHGMRALGIPNTKHFHDITVIEDAVNLHEKLKGALQAEQFELDAEEEFEDTEGNVLDKRTYEDLARQGLL